MGCGGKAVTTGRKGIPFNIQRIYTTVVNNNNNSRRYIARKVSRKVRAMQHELPDKCLLNGPIGAGHAELQHAVSLAG